MPDYRYTARELSGSVITGTLTAGSEQEVLGQLAQRSLFPTSIEAVVGTEASSLRKRRRVRAAQLATFFSQLADLLHAGVPLLRSLDLLGRQYKKGALGEVLKELRDDVADGTRLADAMRRHPTVFNELSASMVRAGEEGGFLEDVLKRIAVFTEQQEDLKARIMGALAYPIFLLVVGTIIVTVMIVYFVPMFAPLFARLEERGGLPLPTVMLLGLSNGVRTYGIWLLLALGGLALWLQTYLATEAGRLTFDRVKLKLIGAGAIVRNLAVARFCRILGTLLKNGVPILPSLRISKDATGNRVLSTAIGKAADNLAGGKSLARPIAACGQFSPEVVEMISVGEEANNLEQVLLDIAENLERRTSRQLELFVRLLEPVMLLVMAAVILFVVMALLLPVFQSSGAL